MINCRVFLSFLRDGIIFLVQVGRNCLRSRQAIEPDIPIELWRALLDGTGVMLCAGLEVLIRPYPSAPYFTNSLETVRGAAATLRIAARIASTFSTTWTA